ncbi:hypothetical protein HPB52_017333 [Rhipicephalus sanguineus]|uniref:Uncharacterized protein n=1 Tax=Rhipicephalus sanguineus TaxID=34632 RepID=A0A9D4T105_RHISA|nr:hypothetical protein HPB52_017333 [Rhipicephalus sanguineus]
MTLCGFPYGCEFNSTEMVWSQDTGYIPAKNTLFTLGGIEELLNEAIALVAPENWLRDCAHLERPEKEAWQRDGAIDTTIDSIIIPQGSESSSFSDSSVSDISGVQKLMNPVCTG